MGKLFEITDKIPSNLLKDRFIVPPFSIFDTKQGYWQERKRSWINLGIKSDLGRGEKLLLDIENFDSFRKKEHEKKVDSFNKMVFTMGGGVCSPENAEKYGRKAQQTSIFDPVLCEITYKWFSDEDSKILDPFAGGSVRGLIAGMLGRSYTGIDLRNEQIEANKKQYKEISLKYDGIIKPNWVVGNSIDIKNIVTERKFDLIFSCPPYYNLEVYSNDKNDLSNKKTYEEFLDSYNLIIKNSCDLLKDNSFAVFVVGNMRDKDGFYYDLVGDTIRAFENVGVRYYNEAIIVNVAGTLPVRTPTQFNSSRKFGKQHQQFLVFYKGNPDKIKEKFGSFE